MSLEQAIEANTAALKESNELMKQWLGKRLQDQFESENAPVAEKPAPKKEAPVKAGKPAPKKPEVKEEVAEKPAPKKPAPKKKPAPAKPAEPKYRTTAIMPDGVTIEDFKKEGWTIEEMLTEGYIELDGDAPVLPAADNADLTPESMNAMFLKKAGEMGDQGASIATILQNFGSTSLAEIDSSKYPEIVDLVNALTPGA